MLKILSRKRIVFLFIAAFIFRLALVKVAFHGDLNNNISWGDLILKGLNGFYERKDFTFSIPNQPPLYVLLFGLVSFLYQSIDKLVWYLNNTVGVFPSSLVWFWRTDGMIYLVKLPSILADLGIGYFIYKKYGVKLSLLWLFNPVTWYNSSIWGQTDPIVNFLGLVMIYFLIQKKLVKSMLFLTLSLLFKGSLLIFLPILFVYALWQKYPPAIWMKAIFLSLILVFLVSIWFYPSINFPIWFFNLYTKQILPGEIGDLSANAFNFWYLVNPGKVLDSSLYIGVLARIWGYLMTGIVVLVAALKLRRNRNEKTFLYSLVMVSLATFLFMTRIHERYMYPFFPIATILIGMLPEIFIPYLVLSITFLLNMYNLFWAPGIPVLEKAFVTTQLPNVLSVVNITVFIVIFLRFLKTRKKIGV